MKYAPDGSPYHVKSRSTGEDLFVVSELKIYEPFTIVFHGCRNFPVAITYPASIEKMDSMSGYSIGFLWVPLSEKKGLDEKLSLEGPLEWGYVCTDLVNGEEWAFYRNNSLKAVSLVEISKRYFTLAATN